MDDRRSKLMKLLEEENFRTVQQLSENMKLSTKTTRKLIKELELDLETHGAEIVSKYGQGIRLHITDRKKYVQYQSELSEPKIPCLDTTKARVEFILDDLFSHTGYIRMEKLADMMYVSRQTLSSDMRQVEKILEKHQLKLIRRPNYGICIEGCEKNIRSCIADYSAERCHLEKTRMKKIGYCMSEALRENDSFMEIRYFRALCVYLSVAVRRLEQGYYLDEEDSLCSISQAEQRIAERMLHLLSKEWAVSFSKAEKTEAASYLSGKVHRKEKSRAAENVVISQEIMHLVNEILQSVYDAFKIDLRNDLELIMVLGKHIFALKERIVNHVFVENPLLQEVREKYSFAFAIAVQAAAVINQSYHTELSDDETGYLAFGFALALERLDTGAVPKNVLLVCNTGHGSTQLLKYQYQKRFGDWIGHLETCDVGELFIRDFTDVDYVISTVPFSLQIPVPVVEISYFLEDKDVSFVKRTFGTSKHNVIGNYFDKALFLPDLKCATKEDVLQYMCNYVIQKKQLSNEFYRLVLERERLARTAFGNLTAMPHPSKTIGDTTFVCVGILDKPVFWDGPKVQVIFLVSLADHDQVSSELQVFYRVTTEFLMSYKCVRNLIRIRDFSFFLKMLEELEQETGAKN